MIIQSIETSFKNAPKEVFDIGFTRASRVSLTKGKKYQVHAFSVWRKMIFFQIIDDSEGIVWLPSFLFKVVDKLMPTDWECNVLSDSSISLIVGPHFVSESKNSYSRMVELYPEEVEKFWERVKDNKE